MAQQQLCCLLHAHGAPPAGTGSTAAQVCVCAAVHDHDDPEYSILKKRLATKCDAEGVDDEAFKSWQLPDLTKVPCHLLVLSRP